MELVPNIVFSLILILSLGFFVRYIKRLRRNINFGKGQTEGEIVLEPGKYTLQAVFADYSHMTHNPPVVSDFIEINVE